MYLSRNFLVIFLFAAIAMAVPLTHLHLKANEQQEFIESQLTGLLIIEQMDALLRDIPLHRGLSFAIKNGHSGFDTELNQVEARIKRGMVQFLLSRDDLLRISVNPSQANRMRDEWLSLEQRHALDHSGDGLQLFEDHNRYMEHLVELIRHVADHSKLILDPHLDSYYLMDVVINQLPEFINNLAKLRGFASGVAGRGPLSTAYQQKLDEYTQSVKYSSNRLVRSLKVLQTVYQVDQGRIVFEFETLIADISAYVESLRARLENNSRLVPTEVFNAGSVLITQLLDRHGDALHELRFIYQHALEQERQQSSRLLLGSILLSLLLVSIAYKMSSSRIAQIFAQKHQAEKKARLAARKSQSFFDLSHDGIHLLDPQGNIIDCNRSFASMLGYTRNEAIGLNVRDWDARFPAEQLPGKIAEWINTPAMFETIHRMKNGKTIAVEISAGGIEIDGARYLYAASRNIEDRKKAERALADAKQQAEDLVTLLKEKNARQNQLFAIIGHELRTPAAAIQMLLEQQGVGDMRPFGRDIVDSTDHLIAVLDDMRVVTHPEESVNAPVKVDSVAKILRSSLTIMQRYINAAGLRVHVDMAEAAAKKCRVKSQLLRQIIFNLVKNATLHSGASELWVTVSAQAWDDDTLRFNIVLEDNGRGIASEDQETIFEAFERSTSEADGLGLGLHVSQSFAREHLRGDLVYADRHGGGAVFTLSMTLPGVAETDKRAPVATHPDKEIMHGLRMLVVEDSDSLRMLANLQLTKLGARVTQAENGAKALKAFDSKSFDLVLTDMFMPIMDGLELCRQLRQRDIDIPIIGLTAATVGDEISNMRNAGASEVLAKPLKVENLIPLVEKFVSRPALPATPIGHNKRPQLPPLIDDPELFDLEGLLRQLDQDAIQAINLFSGFLRQAENLLQDLDSAIAKNKILLIRNLAHKLKGMAIPMRMGRLAQSAEAIKSAVEAGRFNEAITLKAGLDEVFDQSVALAEQNLKISADACPDNLACTSSSCFNICQGQFCANDGAREKPPIDIAASS